MRRTPRPVILILAVFIVAIGCGEDSEDTDIKPPAAPTMKPRSIESNYDETGIRPEASESASDYWIRIEWYPNSEEDLAGYLVYRRSENETEFPETSLGNLTLGQNFPADEDPYYSDYDTPVLKPDEFTGDSRGYYYAVRAYDQMNNLSDLSALAYYRLIPNPGGFAVTSADSGVYYLEWTYESGPDIIDYYMIRVWDKNTEQPQPMWWKKYRDWGSELSVLLNDDGTAEPFVSGTDYVWKLSVVANSDDPSRAPAGCAMRRSFNYH